MSTLLKNKIRALHRRIAGASLIEVLVAFAVLALGITSVVSFQGTLTQNSDHAKARTEAANIGQQKLEELRNFASLATFDGYQTGSDTITVTNHAFTRKWTITSGADYKTIALTVTWPDNSGAPVDEFGVSTGTTVKLNTVIARADPKQTILTVNTSTTTTVSTASTSSSTSGGTTTTSAGTTTTSAATTTTAAVATTTNAETTTTVATTTSSSAEPTTTTLNTPTTTVWCLCKRNGNSANYGSVYYSSDPTNPYYSCTDACCTGSPLKCFTNNCTFDAACPL